MLGIMNKPLVSVIIPAYNCARFLDEAVQSALGQTVTAEIIIVDDCSQDETAAVIEKYATAENIRCFKNPKNLGVAETRNIGVRQAVGEYVAFLDADDIWLPDKLEKQLAAIKNTDFVLCCTARELMDKQGKNLGKIIPVKEEITYKDLLKNNSINCSSVIIRRDIALAFPFERDDLHEDYIMWLKVLKKYQKALGVNLPLLKYRLTGTGKSGSKLASAKTTFKVYRYLGFGLFKSVWYFLCYALNGVKKYFFGGDNNEA